MAFITRQSIEGDILISTEGVAGETSYCWIDGAGAYVPNSLALVINNTIYPVATPQAFSFGVFSTLAPVSIKAGDQIKLKSQCSADESELVTVLPINLVLNVGNNATTCENTSTINARYDDRVRLFFQGNNAEKTAVNLKISGVNLNRSEFTQQAGYLGNITSNAGDFTTNNTSSSVLFSNNLYPSNGTVLRATIKRIDSYQTIRLGYIEVIMALGELVYIDYINGGSEVNIGTYAINDTIDIVSNAGNYVINKNGTALYTATKNITFVVPSGAGSIQPNPSVAGVNSNWTLPTTPGTYGIGVLIGQGVKAEGSATVSPCRLTANDIVQDNAERGATNIPVDTLTGTAPTNCTVTGFKIITLPLCGTLKLLSTPVTVNQVIPLASASSLRIDIPMDCSESQLEFEYSSVSSTSGCQESFSASVLIPLEELPDCDVCKELAEIKDMLKCIIAEQKKASKRA